ncbi:MAG: hypothetical protein MRJ92_09990 [Nitrospira sp.]|nr:hypothetical protein [Nitrospira sp.]
MAQQTPGTSITGSKLPNGSDFLIHLQAEAVREEEVDEVTVIGTAQDITERNRRNVPSINWRITIV